MIQWYHLVLTAYGFWLPNDPRGSWSEFVASWELLKFGESTKIIGNRSRARDPHDPALRRAAKAALKYPPVRFDAQQRTLIAQGFGRAIAETGYCIHACCVGHDHCHLVTQRHERPIERIASHLKSKATMALTAAAKHPLANHRNTDDSVPTPWSKGNWSVYISDLVQAVAAVDYVQRHPAKEGLPPQSWEFISPL